MMLGAVWSSFKMSDYYFYLFFVSQRNTEKYIRNIPENILNGFGVNQLNLSVNNDTKGSPPGVNNGGSAPTQMFI